MKSITLDQLLEGFSPEGGREALLARARSNRATHLVLFQNVCLDSSQLGQQTVLCVGPSCTYKTPADVEGRWLNDLPSQRQYPQAVVEVPHEE